MTVLVFILSFAGMEGVAWLTHKYVMHGLLWVLHRDHHVKGEGSFFEQNDSFFLLFATPGFLLTLWGSLNGFDYRFWAGLGIAAYGLAYFLVHDVFIHRRFRWFSRTDNAYLRAIRRAHKVHHKRLTKEDGACFGMLWVPWKYVRQALNEAR